MHGTKLLAAAAIGALAAPSSALGSCATEVRIVRSSPLAFGTIATAREGGVVVVSPNGAVATLGGVGAGPGASPGSIQLCGPAGARFQLFFETAELDLAAGSVVHRPHVVRNLDIQALGAELYPTAGGQWEGRLGASGRADLRVGGTLTIPPGQKHDSFVAPVRIAVVGRP